MQKSGTCFIVLFWFLGLQDVLLSDKKPLRLIFVSQSLLALNFAPYLREDQGVSKTRNSFSL